VPISLAVVLRDVAMIAPLRLLVVEDSLSDTELMLYELYTAGLELDWHRVETEADYLHQLTTDFDVVISDYRLPQFDAMRALEILQERSLDIPLIVVTGSISEEVAVECMKQGAADYLLKDRLVRLGPAVLKAMQRKQLRTEKRQVEVALQASAARFRQLADNAQDIIYRYQVTPAPGFEYVSLAVTSITGYTPLEHYNDPHLWLRLVHAGDRRQLQQWISDGTYLQPAILRWIRKDGALIWTEHTTVPVHDEAGSLVAIEGIARDITQRKQAEEQLVHNAFHDTLTGLPNRALFLDRLERAVEHNNRHPNYLFAVLFLDLDRFKVINDSLGHSVGDQLLIAIARQLEASLRPTDTVARFGGDEFTILLEDIKDLSDAVRVAQRIQKSLCSPFNLGPDLKGMPVPEGHLGYPPSHQVFTTASIGITFNKAEQDSSAPPGNRRTTPEDYLRDADNAMYRAKELGKARYEIFNPAMHERAVALLQLETDLRRAIERQEFQIYYQPIVYLGPQPGTGRIAGFEALVRWQHPERGLLLPAEFIPVAEETGLSVPIDQWVISEACRQMQQWQKQFSATKLLDPDRIECLNADDKEPLLGSTTHSQKQLTSPSLSEYPDPTTFDPHGKLDPAATSALTISVNLCSPQFRQPELVQYIDSVLQKTNLAPRSLKLEITENVIMKNHESATTRLLELRELGVRLAIDDFGTGYSSLGYLHHFAIDMLKIDRSFIAQIGGSSTKKVRISLEGNDSSGGRKNKMSKCSNLEITETIVTLARKLGVDVTAEGVETAEQLQQLRALKCDYGQGYFFSHPLDSQTAEELMMAQPSW